MLSVFAMQDIVLIVAAYLLGSISCAILLCRLHGFDDPRSKGSGNPGATNMLRTTNKNLAILTVLGDILKGFFPVWLGSQMHSSSTALSLIALAAVLGHLFPVFFQFKGGKGVATTFGVCLALNPLLGLGQILSWLIVAVPFHISSVAALVSAVITPAMSLWLAPEYVAISVVLAAIIVYRHRQNLADLMQGKEKAFSGKTKPQNKNH